jgi:hypothetical protein
LPRRSCRKGRHAAVAKVGAGAKGRVIGVQGDVGIATDV